MIEGQQLRVQNAVYNLIETYCYGYEPATLNASNRQDTAQTAYFCYRFPVPGAKRYFVDPTSTEGSLQPLNTQLQLQSVPPFQVVWVVTFEEELGKAVRKLLRTYLRSLDEFD